MIAKPLLAGLAIQVTDQMVTLHAPKLSQDKLSAFLGRAVDAQGTEFYSTALVILVLKRIKLYRMKAMI